MYKIYGLKMGEKDSFPHRLLPDVPGIEPVIRINCYMWCIKGEGTAILVDTGLNDADAKRGNFSNVKDPVTQLKKIGVDAASVDKVIITHLHYDHFSAVDLYPKATFYIQRKEIEFFTGPVIMFPQIKRTAPDVAEVVRLAYQKRVRYLDGDERILPGISVSLVGGHTPGGQIVVVTTGKGEAVICGDAADLYRNLEKEVIGATLDLPTSLLALGKIKKLASSPELILPAHDPVLMNKFPNPAEGIAEIG